MRATCGTENISMLLPLDGFWKIQSATHLYFIDEKQRLKENKLLVIIQLVKKKKKKPRDKSAGFHNLFSQKKITMLLYLPPQILSIFKLKKKSTSNT